MKFKFYIILLFVLFTKLNGDILNENFLYQIKQKALAIVQPYAPVYYARVMVLLANGAFDALAPYHPTAKALYSTIEKRPENERTIRNKNIAIAYASLRILNRLLPNGRFIWENELKMAGLNPDDISEDLRTAIGIGNFVAEQILNERINDGMNQEGNTKYHKARYSDSVSYRPKNTPYKLEFPDNWQPLIEETDFGVYSSQIHVVPQYGSTIPYAIKDVNEYIAPIPVKSKISNMEGYVEQVQQILMESYTLDDRKKMVAEYFDDKSWSLDGSFENVLSQSMIDFDEYVFLNFAVKIGIFDGGIIMWKEKFNYDTVRPQSAIKYLYENTPLKAWGGPGVGPVEDIKGSEWRSYTLTPPHSEYPSGSTCFCSAQSQVLRRYFNTTLMNFSITFPKGTSRIEPWITPSMDIKLNFRTFDEFVNICGISRLYGGVHFLSAVKEAEKLCKPIGDLAYEFVSSKVNGDDDKNLNNNFEWILNMNDQDKFAFLK